MFLRDTFFLPLSKLINYPHYVYTFTLPYHLIYFTSLLYSLDFLVAHTLAAPRLPLTDPLLCQENTNRLGEDVFGIPFKIICAPRLIGWMECVDLKVANSGSISHLNNDGMVVTILNMVLDEVCGERGRYEDIMKFFGEVL